MNNNKSESPKKLISVPNEYVFDSIKRGIGAIVFESQSVKNKLLYETDTNGNVKRDKSGKPIQRPDYKEVNEAHTVGLEINFKDVTLTEVMLLALRALRIDLINNKVRTTEADILSKKKVEVSLRNHLDTSGRDTTPTPQKEFAKVEKAIASGKMSKADALQLAEMLKSIK